MSLNGIDISHHQGEAGMTVSIFEKMSFDFAIMKATDGTRFVDAWCDKYYQSAKKRGKLLGVYHYANGTNAEKEVDYFLTHCKNYVGEALIALDWEKSYNQSFDNPYTSKYSSILSAYSLGHFSVYNMKSNLLYAASAPPLADPLV